MNNTWKGKEIWLIGFVVLVAVAAYVSGLFVDVTRDGSKYASVAREIFDSGDWIRLKIHGEPYDQKPPLLFWLSAASFHLFGLSNFAFKLPLLLVGLLGVYSLYRLAKGLYDPLVAHLAVAMMVTTQASFLYFMDIHTDTVLMPFVLFSLWQFWEFLVKGRSINGYLGFVGIGLAMLTKGPVGAVVPFFAVISYLLFTRQYRRMLDYRWYLGMLVSIVVILPGLAGLMDQFGWEGIRFFFWTNNAERLAGRLGSSRGDYFFFFHNLLYQFAPWMILLYVAAVKEFRIFWQRRQRDADYFLLGGIWVYFIILALSGGKLPNYIFMLIPLFAVLTAKHAARLLELPLGRAFRWLIAIQGVIYIQMAALVVTVAVWLFPVSNGVLWLLLVAGLVLSGLSLWKGPTALFRFFFPGMLLSAVFSLLVNAHVAPQIFGGQASVQASEIYNQRASAGERIYNYNYESYELFFYAKEPAQKLINDLGLIDRMQQPGAWALTESKVVERIDFAEPAPEVIPLPHVWVNRLNWEYINPATRPRATDTLFLLRSKF
jgi:4-amino-4-deoxy-L-arabinose transferase-like glycosyltransferase